MFKPAHPGEVIRELCIEPLELTVTEQSIIIMSSNFFIEPVFLMLFLSFLLR